MNVHKNLINQKKSRHRVSKLYIKNFKNNSIILRPLLKVSRFKLLKFCDFWNLPIFPDFTNFEISLRRNRLRLQFLPYLKFFLNSKIFKKISQIQTLLNYENQYFQLIIQKLFYSKLLGPTHACPKGTCPKGTPQGTQGGIPHRGAVPAPLWGTLQALRGRTGDRGLDRSCVGRCVGVDGGKARKLELESFRAADQLPPKSENFNYFPKILQYRIFHYFLFSIKKKISFNEIYCFFNKTNIKKK